MASLIMGIFVAVYLILMYAAIYVILERNAR